MLNHKFQNYQARYRRDFKTIVSDGLFKNISSKDLTSCQKLKNSEHKYTKVSLAR